MNITIEYRKNGGEWVSMTVSEGQVVTMSVEAGDIIEFKGENDKYSDSYGEVYFQLGGGDGCTAKYEVGGNIMSMIYGDNFIDETDLESPYTFSNFFNSPGLTSAEKLVLPATTLMENCYEQMFQNCTSLTTAPELPATTLAQYCYSNMFNSCTSLTSAPELPATTLVANCYFNMFYDCSSLTTAPELPATALTYSCYENMFNGCTSLNYIKCLARNISASRCTSYWVSRVTSTGTFVKSPSITEQTWGRGVNGIPSNWTVQDAS